MIRQETITRSVNALNDILDVVKKNNGKVTVRGLKSICKKRQCNSNLFMLALNSGYFVRKSRGVYSTHIKVFEPIHARKCIEASRDMLRKTDSKPKEKKAEAKQKRTISILWGLFKFNI